MKPKLELVKPQLDDRQKAILLMSTVSDDVVSQVLRTIRQDELNHLRLSIIKKLETMPQTTEEFFDRINTDDELAKQLNACNPCEFTLIMQSLFINERQNG